MVSVDTPEDNKAFAEKEQADFPLLSDPDKKVANVYGVISAEPSARPAVRLSLDLLYRSRGKDRGDRQGSQTRHCG